MLKKPFFFFKKKKKKKKKKIGRVIDEITIYLRTMLKERKTGISVF
jgi:hypothetical protein